MTLFQKDLTVILIRPLIIMLLAMIPLISCTESRPIPSIPPDREISSESVEDPVP